MKTIEITVPLCEASKTPSFMDILNKKCEILATANDDHTRITVVAKYEWDINEVMALAHCTYNNYTETDK